MSSSGRAELPAEGQPLKGEGEEAREPIAVNPGISPASTPDGPPARIEFHGWPRPSSHRTFVLHRKQARALTLTGVALLSIGLLAMASWSYMAAQTLRARALTATVAQLEEERIQLARVFDDLEEMEARFSRLQDLFSEGVPRAEPLWLPPPGIGPPRGTPMAAASTASEPPSLWPLTERGFLSRGLVVLSEEAAGGAHPGIDLAVPSGSYFRAVGEGVVVERGEDPVYGLFVVVEHPLGYRSLYAHASVVVVEPGQAVRRGQVLGLTGSSGLSTAPHLHLEITRDGVHVDPLELLVRP